MVQETFNNKKVSYHEQIARQHFVVDRVKLCLISSLITVGKSCRFSYGVAQVPKRLGDAGPTPWDGDVADPQETCVIKFRHCSCRSNVNPFWRT